MPSSGSIAVLYYLDPNGVVSPRTAHLTVTSRDGTKLVETITQAGAPSCSYVLSPSEATFTPDGGAGSFDVTITPPTCDWTLNSNAPLYGIVPVIVERMPGFGRVAYTARRNDNLAFPHITYFEIGDRAHGNPPSRFWIHVDARPEFISRSSREAAK